MTKKELETYIESMFGILPDHPFARYPEISVFRHSGNKKWFAAQMTVPKTTIGMKEDGVIDIVNVKCDPEILRSFHGQPGIYPAYHMNRNHWLTVALDGRVDERTIEFLLGISYDLTKRKNKTGKNLIHDHSAGENYE